MQIIGTISDSIISLLDLSSIQDKNIYLGDSNIAHMESSHPDDYNKYKNELRTIISNPDYIGINKSDGSIEFVKEYCLDEEYVKVAVRVSSSQKYYARSVYVLNRTRVNNFIAKGTLKKLDK